MILRFREDERNDRHCRVTVFSAEVGPTAGNSGQLVLDTALWDELKVALDGRPSLSDPVYIGRVEISLSPDQSLAEV